MRRSGPLWPFIAKNAVVWVAMTLILVVVPDTLERWIPLPIARTIGWVVACGLWVIVVESEWKARYGPVTRIAVQFVLWISAALVAIWISDAFRT
jgi:hypothetical protein